MVHLFKVLVRRLVVIHSNDVALLYVPK
jgi:hypothetical protein